MLSFNIKTTLYVNVTVMQTPFQNKSYVKLFQHYHIFIYLSPVLLMVTGVMSACVVTETGAGMAVSGVDNDKFCIDNSSFLSSTAEVGVVSMLVVVVIVVDVIEIVEGLEKTTLHSLCVGSP